MKVVLRLLSLTLLICGFAGCGGAPQGSSDAANPGSSEPSGEEVSQAVSAPADATPAANSGPAAVVAQFYEALRQGSDETIASLLSDKAREETANSGLGIQSQASESLSYQISQTEYVDDQMDGAHVRTTWMEPGPDGETTATEVIWVLRKQHDGWRISGMATPVVAGELPLLFNLEEPEDMLRKKDFVEQQIAEPAESQADTAEAPGSYAAPEVR